ncbi:MAG: tetratricopeptide repeat protein [Pseudomonadota bacterium]
MSLVIAPALLVLLQVGPNPNAGGIQGVPDELANRPPREEASQQPTNPTSAWLQTCLDQLDEDPARAHSQAQIKRAESTGTDRVIANHCLGLAATELGLWEDARTAFQEAKDETPVDDLRTRARFGTMAGNAALGGRNRELALQLLVAAQQDARAAASAPLEAIAAQDAARVLVALERPGEALTALETATRLQPDNSDGWLLTATLLRRLDRLAEAQAAIERAAGLNPVDGAIGLEAGVIAVLDGREEAARQSWQSVVNTQPNSAAAQTANGYLAQLGPAPDGTAQPTPEPEPAAPPEPAPQEESVPR